MRTLLLGLAAAACATPTVYERDAAWQPRTVSDEELFTLHSPYDEGETAFWAWSLRWQVVDVGRLFGVSSPQDLLVRLVPLEVAEPNGEVVHDLRAWPTAQGGRTGYTITVDGGGVIVLYVPVDNAPRQRAMRWPVRWHSSFRHELTHFFLARLGISVPLWLEEGLARAVGYGDIDGNGTVSLSVATRNRWTDTTELPGTGAVDRLRSWDRGDFARLVGVDAPAPEDVAKVLANYRDSHSLVLFLMQRGHAGDLLGGLREIAAISAGELRGLETAWLRWFSRRARGPRFE